MPLHACSAGDVWIVDDSATHREATRRVLAERHNVTTFADGGTVLERFAANTRPDVLVLDWHLPDIGGLEICTHLRVREDEAALPILIFSGEEEVDALLEALDAGANDFVRKQTNPVELVARVNGLMRLRRATAKARAAEHYRELLLGVVGHDLRTPLAAVMAAGQRLRGMDLPGAEPSLRVIASGSRRMAHLIDQVMDLTRIRLGAGIDLNAAEHDLGHVVRAVVSDARAVHPTRVIDVVGPASVMAFIDPDRCAQVLSNLIDNALRHGAAEAPIQVTVTDAPPCTRVSNAGKAIDPGLLGTIFDPFRRGASLAARKAGLGLGLFIVEQIVRAHGGTIEVSSTTEAGTSFGIYWPRRPDAPARLSVH